MSWASGWSVTASASSERHFQPSTCVLQVSHVGSGTTTSSPAGINCTTDADAGTLSGTCAANYTPSTVVSLTATAATGWSVSGWSRDSDCSGGQVTMNAARRCTATFVRL